MVESSSIHKIKPLFFLSSPKEDSVPIPFGHGRVPGDVKPVLVTWWAFRKLSSSKLWALHPEWPSRARGEDLPCKGGTLSENCGKTVCMQPAWHACSPILLRGFFGVIGHELGGGGHGSIERGQ